MIYKNYIMDIYRVIAEDELRTIKMYHDNLKFFMGIITGIVAGTALGIFKASKTHHYVMILFGPVLLYFICEIAKKGIDRFYGRLLETITMKAKLEHVLDMTEIPAESNEITDYPWAKEAIIPTRHLDNRGREGQNSKDWVKENLARGYNRLVRRLFLTGKIFAALLFIFILFLLLYQKTKIFENWHIL